MFWEIKQPVLEDEAVEHHVDDEYEILTDFEDDSVASDAEGIEDANDIKEDGTEADSSDNASDDEDESDDGSSDKDSDNETKDELSHGDDDEKQLKKSMKIMAATSLMQK